jgi:hypothetical protein
LGDEELEEEFAEFGEFAELADSGAVVDLPPHPATVNRTIATRHRAMSLLRIFCSCAIRRK